jgi:hypothetical protein
LPATGIVKKPIRKYYLNINYLRVGCNATDGTRPAASGRRKFGRIYQRFCLGSL